MRNPIFSIVKSGDFSFKESFFFLNKFYRVPFLLFLPFSYVGCSSSGTFFFGSVLGRVSYETMCRFLPKIGMIESGGTFTLFFVLFCKVRSLVCFVLCFYSE